MTRLRKWTALLILGCVAATSLGGCVVQHRRDGGITFRPFH